MRTSLAELYEAFEEVSFAPESGRWVDDERFLVIVRFVAKGRGSGVPVDRSIARVWTRRGPEATRLEVYWTPEEALAAVGLPD